MKPKIIDYTMLYNNRFHNLLFRWIDNAKIRILKKKLDGKGLKILDIGCGTGAITSKIKGCCAYGIDHNEQLLKQAKANGLVVRKGKLESIPFENNFFDAVISIDSMEHVASRDKVFKEVKRVLKPDGELLLFTPAFSSPLWVVAEKFVTLITKIPPGHYSPFTKESLAYIISNNFKKAIELRYINFTLGLFAHAKQKQM